MGLRSRSGKPTKQTAKAGDKGKLSNSNSAASTTSTTTQVEKQQSNQSLFRKTFTRGAELTSEEALAATHWLRQAFGIIFGITCGLARLTGVPIIMSFLILAFTGPPSLLSSLHEIDIDEVAKVGLMQTEGLLPAFALFMLSWIISYTVRLPPQAV